MHKWRAKAAAHQAAGETAYVWQADSQAHNLERGLRALLRVRRRAWWAASPKTCRSKLFPVSVIRPRWWWLPLESSDGTVPM